METAHLHDLIELEDSYWWHVAKRRLAMELLAQYAPPPGKLVEGGIGSARNLAEFESMGYEVKGLDTMPAAVDHGRHRGIADIVLHDLELEWPLENDSVQAVVLLDVLEHVPDPVNVLRHAKRVLKEGGAIIFTVPAYPWLMGKWDERLGHYRRYHGPMLRQQAAAAGLKVVRLSHWNAFTLPPAIVVRLFDRLTKRDRPAEFPRVSSSLNNILLSCATAERIVSRYLPVPVGLSLFGVLR